jgi:hypothetical protein
VKYIRPCPSSEVSTLIVIAVRKTFRSPASHPHLSTGPTIEGFPKYLIFQNFSNICGENSCLALIWQEQSVSWMNIWVYSWRNIPEFILERESFMNKFVYKMKKHVLFSVSFFLNIVAFTRKSGKICYSHTSKTW